MSNTEKLIRNQRALDYVVYRELCGALGINPTRTNTSIQISRLKLAFQELKEDQQVHLCEKAEKIVKEEILPKLPKAFLEKALKIKVIGKKEYPESQFLMIGKPYIIQIYNPIENKTNIRYFVKKSADVFSYL